MNALLQKIKALFKIGRLVSSDDTGKFQSGVFYYMGSSAKGQIFIPYGDLSLPPDGSQMAVFSQNGNESNAIAFASDPERRTVIGLEKGEKGISNYLTGSYILCKANGDIDVSCEANVNIIKATNINLTVSNEVNIDAVQININGDVEIVGDLVNNGVTFSNHIHSQGSDSDGDSEVDTGTPHE